MTFRGYTTHLGTIFELVRSDGESVDWDDLLALKAAGTAFVALGAVFAADVLPTMAHSGKLRL